MKKIVLLLCLSISVSAIAQEHKGIIIGKNSVHFAPMNYQPNMNAIPYPFWDYDHDFQRVFNFQIGYLINKPLSEKFRIEYELAYSSKSLKKTITSTGEHQIDQEYYVDKYVSNYKNSIHNIDLSAVVQHKLFEKSKYELGFAVSTLLISENKFLSGEKTIRNISDNTSTLIENVNESELSSSIDTSRPKELTLNYVLGIRKDFKNDLFFRFRTYIELGEYPAIFYPISYDYRRVVFQFSIGKVLK